MTVMVRGGDLMALYSNRVDYAKNSVRSIKKGLI